MRTGTCSLALLGALALASPALGQQADVRPIAQGQAITVEQRDARAVPYAWLTCFELDTQPGQNWNIFIGHAPSDRIPYPDVVITARETCDFQFEDEIDETAIIMQDGTNRKRLHFVAGGGPYRIIVRASNFARRITTSAVLYATNANFAQARSRRALLDLEEYAGERASPTASTNLGPGGQEFGVGASFRDCDTCPEMVALPTGSFLMGSPAFEEGRNADEGPAHQVTFARPFAMGKYEVTFDEWNACAAAGACRAVAVPSWGGGRRPVVNVSWVDARVYADWLSRQTGERYFLPSEAEWEYAARAGTATPWNTGDAIITDDANILDQFKQPVPGGGFPPNAFGLFDMHGNVAEWVLDCHDVGYFGVPADGGANVSANCASRVARGGSFRDTPGESRSAARIYVKPTTAPANFGFRVARAL